MTSKGGASCVRVDKVAVFSVAYINVKLSTYCKIRYVSNLQRHRAVLLAIARLSCYYVSVRKSTFSDAHTVYLGRSH